jgi:hypothetical protein
MGKNIAVFADGTGNTIGKHDSNVLRLCRMADLRNRGQQLVTTTLESVLALRRRH